MIQYNEIVEAMRPMVGFSDYRQLEIQAELHRSLSGARFEDAHPMVTLHNLSQVMPKQPVIYPVAIIGKDYTKGSIVNYTTTNTLYIALADTVFTVDVEDSLVWSKTDELSIWLQSNIDTAIKEVVQNVLSTSIITKQGKEILFNIPTIYTGKVETKISEDSVSVVAITPVNANGVAIRVNAVRAPVYPVYVFNGLDEEPVHVITNPYESVVLKTDIEANSIFNTWYFVYTQETGRQVKTAETIKTTQFFDIEVLEAESLDFDGTSSILSNLTSTTDSMGLDLDISAVCDFTGLFIKNKYDFVDLIKLQFGVNSLKEFAYNPSARVNRTAAIASRVDVLFALDGDYSKFAKSSGLSHELRQAYDAFILNTRGYNSRCLPCTRRGVSYRTIGR